LESTVEQVVIGFVPPIVGVDFIFNTFRMGRRYSTLEEGQRVYLMDEKRKMIFGEAEVIDVSVGPLGALCAVFAHENHTELDKNDGDSAERLYRLLSKLYGPHIVSPNKTATVIKLRRIDVGSNGT
jgi:hypothetical protein